MDSENQTIPYAVARSVGGIILLTSLEELGLETTNPIKFYYSSDTKESFLKVVDKRKWFLAKIKYGI